MTPNPTQCPSIRPSIHPYMYPCMYVCMHASCVYVCMWVIFILLDLGNRPATAASGLITFWLPNRSSYSLQLSLQIPQPKSQICSAPKLWWPTSLSVEENATHTVTLVILACIGCYSEHAWSPRVSYKKENKMCTVLVCGYCLKDWNWHPSFLIAECHEWELKLAQSAYKMRLFGVVEFPTPNSGTWGYCNILVATDNPSSDSWWATTQISWDRSVGGQRRSLGVSFFGSFFGWGFWFEVTGITMAPKAKGGGKKKVPNLNRLLTASSVHNHHFLS